MSRYIDADALLEKAHTHFDWNDYIDVEDIINFTTADVQEIRHGNWIKGEFGSYYICNICGQISDFWEYDLLPELRRENGW